MAHSNHGGAANLTGPPVIDEDGLTRQLANGLLEADYVGCGFMLVRREVFLRRLEAFPERAAPQAAPQWCPVPRAMIL